MKLIDIGICVNNKDPKGIGRIRAVRYNDYIGEKEKSVDYEEWGDKDPFVCCPFLPTNINFIPLEKQAVKIINYNPDKETVNQEYIAGPFTTRYDYNTQVYSQQVENTTYGIHVKHSEDILKPHNPKDTFAPVSLEYVNPRSKNVFANEKDYGIYGKSGSDLIFTDGGIILRGGKLLSKDAASVKDRKTMLQQPIMSNKLAKITLKKFPKKMDLVADIKTDVTYDSATIKYIVEYDLDNLTTPSRVNFYLYKVDTGNVDGDTYNSSVFNEFTAINTGFTKFIHTTGSTTFSVSIDSLQSSYIETRHIINNLHDLGLKSGIRDLKLNDPSYSTYSDEDMHPFYFRPTSEFINRNTTNSENINRTNFISSIEVCKVGPGSGLIWSQERAIPKPKTKETMFQYGKINNNSPEQTFGSIVSDKVFLLSTDTNETDKVIDFNNLDKYDFTQEDYITNILPKTYSSVRGENLIKLLYALIDLLLSHQHNLVGPLVQGDPNYTKLMNLISSIENDLLNNSIRIN